MTFFHVLHENLATAGLFGLADFFRADPFE